VNYSDYFEKISRRFEEFGKYCPRLKEYEKLFNGSVRVRDAVSEFHATVIEFCTKALLGIQEKGIQSAHYPVYSTTKHGAQAWVQC
jgi:hypothetical protein